MSSRSRPRRRRQLGAITVAGVVWVILMVSAAILAIMLITGSSVDDSADAEKHIAALFLAESGVERAQASISKAVTTGGYVNNTCTALFTGSSIAMGRGSFIYESAQSTPALCGGWNAPCTECNFVVRGDIGALKRRVQSQIKAKFTEGVMGHGDAFTLQMNALKSGGAAFTSLAYRATATLATDVSSNAKVGTCVNTGGTCDTTTRGWDMQRTGTNNVSNMGAFAPVSALGYQTITTQLVTNAGTLAARNYVHTGVYFYPWANGGTVDFVGHYAEPVGGNPTASTSLTSGTLANGWTCNTGGGTSADWSRAALADTLVYGFGSKPAQTTAQLNGVRFARHPLKRVVSLTGDQGDAVYSQIWFSWNPAYWPNVTASSVAGSTTITLASSTASPTVGTTLAVQSGTGAFDMAEFTGAINGRVLTVSAVSSGTLRTGDALFGRFLVPGVQLGAQISGTTGGVGAYNVCTRTPTNTCAEQTTESGPITARVGVVGTLGANSFQVSRAPTTALSAATVCGGACAFFFGPTGRDNTYTLSNITSGDDWASGFACLRGVDPSTVQVLGVTELKRTFWAELIR